MYDDYVTAKTPAELYSLIEQTTEYGQLDIYAAARQVDRIIVSFYEKHGLVLTELKEPLTEVGLRRWCRENDKIVDAFKAEKPETSEQQDGEKSAKTEQKIKPQEKDGQSKTDVIKNRFTFSAV